MPGYRSDYAVRAFFVLAGVAYLGVPWEIAAGFPLDPGRSYLSELAAADQRTSLFFRTMDAAAGVLILAAVRIGRLAASEPRTLRLSVTALTLFAYLTIADALFPMACATSAGAACARADAAGLLGVSHQIHSVTSAAALAAVVCSAVLIAITALRTPALKARWRVPVLFGVALLVVATVIVTFLAVQGAASGVLPRGGGYVQRGQVVLLSVYILTFASMLTAIRAARGAQPPASAEPT